MMRRTKGVRAIAALLCAWLLAIVIGPATAYAEEAVAVLGVEPVGGTPASVASQLTTALKNRVLRMPGYRLVQAKNLDEVKLVFGCVEESPACMARAGRSFQATRLLWGAVSPTPSGFSLSLHFLDVQREVLEKSLDEPITGVEASQPAEAIARLTSTFLVSSMGTIKLACDVVGAQVLLGSSVKGLTDESTMLLQDVPLGKHQLLVRKRGYRTWRRQIEIAAGTTLEIRVEMTPLVQRGIAPGATPLPGDEETPVVRRQATRDGWKVAFWSGAAVTVGLGVGMLVTGLGVLDLEKDKEEQIMTVLYDPDHGLSTSMVEELRTGNACGAASRTASLGPLSSICDDGNTRATIFNVLLGAGILTATVSAYFLYKAYLEPPAFDEQPVDDGGDPDDFAQPAATPASPPAAVRWRLLTGLGPDGAHLGVSIGF